MMCFNHPNRDAVVSCNQCGKGLCRDCTIELNGQNYCLNCFEGFVKYQKKLLFSLNWRIIFFIVFFIMGIIGAIIEFTQTENYVFENSNAIPNIIFFLIIGSIPIGFYYMRGTPDPYVPISYKSAGILMLGNLILKSILGPIFMIKAIYDYFKIKKAKTQNELLIKKLKEFSR